MTSSKKTDRKMSPILSLIWWFGGATPSLLKEWPTEWGKYTGIGISVLTTGLLAAISGGYVFYTVSNSFSLAFIVGVVWSLIILNFDRAMVSTLIASNERESQLAALTEQLLKALPRVILGIVIALVISKPLQMVIFQQDIQTQIYQQHSESLDNTRQHIAVTEREIDNLNESLKLESQKLTNVSAAYLNEITGRGGTRIPGLGPASRLRLEELKRTEEEVKTSKAKLENQLIQKTSELAVLKNQQDDLTRTLQSAQSSFASRYDTFSSLAKNDRRIMLVGLLISALIILLEVSPVLVKLLSPRGPYDDVLSRNTASLTEEISQPATQLDLKLQEVLSQALDDSFLKRQQEKLKL